MFEMKPFVQNNLRLLIYLVPTLLLCLYFLKVSHLAPLHDFSNSYFPAKMLQEGINPETVIFDIYEFNNYVWEQGHKEELVDYYVNSPFTLALFYPLSFIESAHSAKLAFNVLSIISFLLTLFLLAKNHLMRDWLLLFVPVVFFIPIRNQILFGQSYFIILFLVVFGFHLINEKRNSVGAGLFSLAVLLKFFPAFYGISLLFKQNWKSVVATSVISLLVVIGAISITGYSLWEKYFFDVLPHTMESGTATDFRINYQSFDVFLKRLLIRDSYYNPLATLDSITGYYLLNWLFKGVVLGAAIFASYRKKSELFTLLVIWVVALFLLQSRTATYAQILWIIPLFALENLKMSNLKKVMLVVLIGLICNLPFHLLSNYPLGMQFLRLWLVIIFALSIYYFTIRSYSLRYLILSLLLLLPFHIGVLTAKELDNSTYVLLEKQYFMVYDFYNDNGTLSYRVLGKNGDENIRTETTLNSFDENVVEIVDNQVFYKGQQITFSKSLKKKPVLINDCYIYYLSDHRSRRAVFTLKKVEVCSISEKNKDKPNAL